MNTIYRTYKVKHEDTLESIAEENGLDIEELKEYHNKKANSYDQIDTRLPDFLLEIILPPKGYGVKNGKEVWLNENEADPKLLSVSFGGRLHYEVKDEKVYYGILKTIQSGSNEATIISYKVSIHFHPVDQENNRYVTIDRFSKTFINDQEPDLIADELALSCTAVLYPIILKVDANRLITDIYNYEEILTRWREQKTKKIEYYKGEIAEKYFQLFEASLLTKDYLLKSLKNDWLFATYFNAIYKSYNTKSGIKNAVEFPIVPNTKPVQYEVDQKAIEFIQNKRIKIEMKGKCFDKRSKADFRNKANFPSFTKRNESTKGQYRALYFLEPYTHSIQSAYVNCNLDLDIPKSVSISVSMLDNQPNINSNKKSDFIEEENQNDDKKKSFWKSLFS